MGLQRIIEAAERVGERDESRRRRFREEFETYEADESEVGRDVGEFPATREAIEAEREALESLNEELGAEEGNIEELVDYAEFLTAEQAVEHRDRTVEKLQAHNTHLRTFHQEMVAALDVVEANLETLRSDGPAAVESDPEPHFRRAYDALEAHNEAVDGLGTNMTILNAYLV